MKLNFTKMHGCGNDYIYIDCTGGIPFDPVFLAQKMSPRHYSVGADGIVLICHSDICDYKMRMFNSDGSEGSMCGNALRCIGKFVYDNKMTDKKELTVETKGGTRLLRLTVLDEKVQYVSVNMGKAVLVPEKIPLNSTCEMVNSAVNVLGCDYRITALSVGNPHQVIFCDDPNAIDIEKTGPHFENSLLFPDRVNTEFAKIISDDNIYMRVWERGSGETYACGSGACAVAVAAVLNGYCSYDVPIKVFLIGGELVIIVHKDLSILMTGPAEKVYDGIYEI